MGSGLSSSAEDCLIKDNSSSVELLLSMISWIFCLIASLGSEGDPYNAEDSLSHPAVNTHRGFFTGTRWRESNKAERAPSATCDRELPADFINLEERAHGFKFLMCDIQFMFYLINNILINICMVLYIILNILSILNLLTVKYRYGTKCST